MADMKNLALEGFRENTMTKEQLLALKTQMNAKALCQEISFYNLDEKEHLILLT